MISGEKIKEAAQALAEAAKPVKVVLFGSYARGDATEDSDIDFLVIKRKVENRGRETTRLRETLIPLKVYADVLVYSEAEVEKRKNWCTTPVYWALREGKVLYDSGE